LSRGLRAAFFITPAWIGTAGYLEWNQARELLDRGMIVGAHGLDHTLLSSLPECQVRSQLREARRLMHARLGQWPVFLSLPGGAGGAKAVRVAQEEGYRVVAGSVPRRCGRARVGQALPRFALRRDDTLGSFRRLIEQRPGALLHAELRYHLLTWLRKALGGSLYERLRYSWAQRVARR
jgi:peptidoglycan/xylan/chitin deacetylase (PgdA/CDA1 family)